MDTRVDEDTIRMLGKEIAKGINTEADIGDIDLDTPRDREGTFEPQIVKKGQSRLTQMDDQILSLYAKGMSTRDITATFKELYLSLIHI